ncbi:MAG: hypothetical protein WBF53_13515 [Litorimonas sp.]
MLVGVFAPDPQGRTNARLTHVNQDRPDAALAALNAVRLIVVLFIGMGYASTMAKGPGTPEWLALFGFDPSYLGLQILFFLSGYLAWRSLAHHGSPVRMLRSRARRNLPWVALYTLLVTAVLYPLLCNHDAPMVKGTADLALYFIRTATLIDPGTPMPGALDDALYACLLQGAIWSLRIGALAFIGLALIWAVGLRSRHWTAILCGTSLTAFVATSVLVDRMEMAQFVTAKSMLSFAWPFLLGAALFSYRESLPRSGWAWGLIAAILIGLATLHWSQLPWSYAVSVLVTGGLCALATALLFARPAILCHWPNLALPVFLGVWPTTQSVLHLWSGLSTPALVFLSLAVTFGLAIAFKAAASVVLAKPVHRRVQAT